MQNSFFINSINNSMCCRQSAILGFLIVAFMCFIGFCGCTKTDDIIKPDPAYEICYDPSDARDSLGLCEAQPPVDWNYTPPLPIVQDTPCTNPQQVLTPAFTTMDMEITDQSVGERIFCAGTYCDTISIDETGDQAEIIKKVLKLYRPQYNYNVYSNGNDSRRVAFIVDTTNDVNQFKQKVYMRYNGVKHYWGWAVQGFIFSGALVDSQLSVVIKKYPSVRRFNFRLTDEDSTRYIDYALAILGECKEGRDWADFRFNPYMMTDSILQAYEDAGWNKVLSFTSDPESRYIAYDDRIIDWRLRDHVSDQELQEVINLGYQVIVSE